MRLSRHASRNYCSPSRHPCASSTCEEAPKPQAAPLPFESRHSSDAIDLRRRLAGALQSSVRPSQVRGHEGTKSDQDPASPHEGVCTVAHSTLLLEALMARSFAPSLRPTLRPFLASGLARAQVTKRGATTLLGARLLAHVARQFDAGGDYHGFNRFQSSQRIGADASLTIRYRPRHRAMCSADKSKRAQKVVAHLPEPLNARQKKLYDEPGSIYQSGSSRRDPPPRPPPLGPWAAHPPACLRDHPRSRCCRGSHLFDPEGTWSPPRLDAESGKSRAVRLALASRFDPSARLDLTAGAEGLTHAL